MLILYDVADIIETDGAAVLALGRDSATGDWETEWIAVDAFLNAGLDELLAEFGRFTPHGEYTLH